MEQIESGSQAEEREGQIPPPSKRIKLNKVAEVVLVLAAMGKMRNGVGLDPTDAELGLMEEAMEGLVRVCEGFAPSEVFPSAVFGSVIDDLGLNRLKDQKLGDCAPKPSISHRMLISKRKMEEAEKFSLPSRAQPSQGNFSSVEERSAPPKILQMAKSNQAHVSSGNSPSMGASWNSTSLPYQLPTSEVKPMVSTALPGAGRPQMNAVFALPAQANYSTNSSSRTPSWPLQPQAVQSAKIGSGNQVPANKAPKVDTSVGHGLSPQMTSMETKAPTTTVLPPRGMKQVNASLANRHSEIGKIIQKILQPKVPEHQTWVPPSRGYMNKALTCQMCMETVTQINGILICDSCEKGYHLKCLQSNNQRGVATGEWHCRKCLSLNNVKLLAPKYGRVTRSMNASKTSSSNSADVEYISNFGASHDVSQPAINSNSSTSMQNLPTTASTLSHQVSGSKPEDATKIQDNNIVASKVEADGKVSSGSSPNMLMNASDSDSFAESSPVDSSTCDEKTDELKLNAQARLDTDSSDHSLGLLDNNDGKMVDLKSNTVAKLEMVSDLSNISLIASNIQDNQSNDENMRVEDSKISGVEETFKPDSSLTKDREDAHNSPLDAFHVVNWVGDPVQDLKEKIHYVSCSINGRKHRVMDHALIRFDDGKLVPSKLQAMWEDKATRKKWVTVYRYYFPGDLPETVGHPCGMESNEVCESSSGTTLPANLIENSCQVLPPKTYAEEIERRRNSGSQLNLPPLYMCRWIYDEAKGLFRDISS